MELHLFVETFGRPYLMAPDVPADRVRGAAQGVHGDDEGQRSLAEAQRIGLAIDPIAVPICRTGRKDFATPRTLSRRQGRAGV